MTKISTSPVMAKIKKALSDYNALVHFDLRYDTATKSFLIHQMENAVNRLIDVCESIDSSRNNDNRTVYDIRRSLLAQGQPITSFLWLGNQRDTITNAIESFYGISFSSLSMWNLYKNNETGVEAYLAHRDTCDYSRTSQTPRKSTLITNLGEYIFIEHNELAKWSKIS